MSGRYLVVGLRRSGLAACEAIARVWPGAEVIATDASADVDTARLDALGIEHRLGAEVVPVAGLTALVKSPGVPGEVPQVAAARAAGVPVWSEVELAARMLPDNPIAGVTGTNGKTTTTHLLGAMLTAGGLECEVAGNVGRPLSELAGRVAAQTWIACELSSFQLEDIDRLRCRVAVILNVTPDHLDRHRSLAEYTRCKLRILENQGEGDTAVLNGDDAVLRAEALPGRRCARVVHGGRTGHDRLGSTPGCGASTTSRTRSPRPPPRVRRASPGRRSTRRCAHSHRRRTGSSRWPRPGASSG